MPVMAGAKVAAWVLGLGDGHDPFAAATFAEKLPDGVYRLGDDAGMLAIASSANIACGFHAGDPLVMHETLTLAARARALVDGRLAPSRADVAALAEPVLKHRMALTISSRAEGVTLTQIIARLVARHLG